MNFLRLSTITSKRNRMILSWEAERLGNLLIFQTSKDSSNNYILFGMTFLSLSVFYKLTLAISFKFLRTIERDHHLLRNDGHVHDL